MFCLEEIGREGWRRWEEEGREGGREGGKTNQAIGPHVEAKKKM